MRPQNKFRSLIGYILNFLLPDICSGCGRKNFPLCADCLACAPRAQHPQGFKLFAAYSYHNRGIKKSLWNLKYKGIARIAPIFAPGLHDTIIEHLSETRSFHPGDERPFVVLPIPVTANKLRERGYNQAELLARALCEYGGEKTFAIRTDILLKTKDTISQVKTGNRTERLNNLHGSFSLADNTVINGADILVIDDIITTSATIEEVRRILLKAGARTVLGLAVAH